VSTSHASASIIMLIRHAEKPPDSPPPHGVSLDGHHEKDSLTVQGWQRAGALACLFAPTHGTPRTQGLAEPRFLYASNPHKHKSKRSQETLTPLARKLGLEINTDFTPGEEEALARDARTRSGVVLICWRHQHLPHIAHHLLGNNASAPQSWADDRYDVVWVLRLDPASRKYSFTAVAQRLLHGDAPIATW
jgi:hypothetical protein